MQYEYTVGFSQRFLPIGYPTPYSLPLKTCDSKEYFHPAVKPAGVALPMHTRIVRFLIEYGKYRNHKMYEKQTHTNTHTCCHRKVMDRVTLITASPVNILK